MLGLEGQICCLPVDSSFAVGPLLASAGSAGPGPLPSDAKCRSVSGTTARTDGLTWRCLTSAAESVADIALMIEKL